LGLTGEQCDSHCMMAGSPVNAESNWPAAKQWVDSAGYDRLLDKLTTCKGRGSGVVYVSGIIAEDDSAKLGWTFYQPEAEREVDFPSEPGEHQTPYGILFVDAKGNTLSESELPLSWTHPELDAKLPATFFAGYARFPAGTAEIQIWNRTNKKLLVNPKLTAKPPVLERPSLKVQSRSEGRFLDVSWNVSDADGDTLRHFVMISPDRGGQWWPVAHALKKPSYSLDLADVPKASYTVRIMITDGVNVQAQDGSIEL
jgi:hypothetical protein